MRYLQGVEQGDDVTMFAETVTPDQIHLEKLMLGLRRRSGVLWQDALEDLSDSRQQQFKKTVAMLKEKKMLAECNGRLVLTPAGQVVENEVIAQLSR